jgi:hypothetical protein
VSSGTDGQVKNLALLGTDIWVVGDFKVAGRRSSRHVSTYTMPEWFASGLVDLRVEDTGGSVRLWWDHAPSAGLVGFEVQRSDSGGTSVTLAGPELLDRTARSFEDSTLPGGETYTYRVIARGRGTLKAIQSKDIEIPARDFALDANMPNPFNPETTLRFTLPRSGRVRLSIHDPAGRLVAVLHEGNLAAGPHAIRWNGRDQRDHGVASGAYLTRLEWEGVVRTRKMTLLK